MNVIQLEQQLNDFNPDIRREALKELDRLVEAGKIHLPEMQDVANMHCHTFFSFNAYGYSPTGLAWLAKKNGYKYMGIVDFDVLDGVEEFLSACDTLQVRGSAGLETRVFIPEFSSREINSPGEPGIYYTMAIGFIANSVPPSVAPILADMRRRAEERNRAMVQRLNAYLDPLKIDYDAEVLPLTPAGTATERHILVAYQKAAEKLKGDGVDEFWAEKIGLPVEKISALGKDPAAFQNTLRSKLMKKGGVGYVKPDAGDFPSIEDVNRMAQASGALPCAAWLDGLSTGEQAITELLEILIRKGTAALNIVPDRNWNIADEKLKQIKVQNLYDIVKLAKEFDLPLNIGTEMNSPGQKVMDDFSAPELGPVKEDFIAGAQFIYGHTALARACQKGYQSDWAKTHLPARKERNEFYQTLGQLVPPGFKGLLMLKALPAEASPAEMLSLIKQQVK